MKPESVNKKWACSVTFTKFCSEDMNIAKLSKEDAKKLYEQVTGKKVKSKNKGE